jgi:hypothetical protein
MDQDPDAAAECAGNRDLVPAHQSNIMPAKLAGRQRRKLGGQVRRGSEEGTPDIFDLEVIGGDDLEQELAGSCQDRLTGIRLDGGGATDASAVQRHEDPPINERA